jgi:uncharacterized protein YqgV (UPF0045/DUF77 family)
MGEISKQCSKVLVSLDSTSLDFYVDPIRTNMEGKENEGIARVQEIFLGSVTACGMQHAGASAG